MKNKIVRGIELLNMIANGEFKNGDKIIERNVYSHNEYSYKDTKNDFYCDEENRWLLSAFNIKTIMGINFEILSETEEIDIDSIEEVSEKQFKLPNGIQNQISYREQEERAKINEIIKAIKQMNRKLED